MSATLGTAVLSGREVRRSPERARPQPVPNGQVWCQVGKGRSMSPINRWISRECPLGRWGADRGTKTSQERRSSAQSCQMSFRWEVNHNREQRTPERAVRRSAVQPSSRHRENRQPSLLCSPSVQPTIAVLTDQAFRSWSSSIEYHLTRRSLQAALVLCADLSLDKSAVKCRRPPVPYGQVWRQPCQLAA